MEIRGIAPSLRDRLGQDASSGLVRLLNDTKAEMAEDVIRIVGDRFERRLAEEISRMREEMAQGFAALRQEIAGQTAALRKELADQRVDLLRWAFIFWVGQFFTTASLLAVLVRYLEPR